MKLEWKKASNAQSTRLHEVEGVPFLTFPKLEEAGVTHGFSTRLGGVSEGIFASMNLSYNRGDEKASVDENYRRMGKAIGFTPDQLVFSNQVHDTKIKIVTKEDCGKVMTGMDGLMTDEKGICLVTSYADCVPLFFYDPVKGVVAVSHSGWKGTVNRMGKKTVEKMESVYGSKAEDIIAAIGPSICQKCYEISEDVAIQFADAFPEEWYDTFMVDKGNGKYQLDLWKVNEYILLDAGILREHLDITDLCTCCNPELLFSHRASKGKRGNLAGFIRL
ncbi:MAG: peptidoglycan editing factor PgeF [Anaerostipes sp.]|nr:peptidoglycan editing factor PgeF [Anaerostipes sp.]MDD5968496.1 peptidoglycan editing factor PgeF [Anaerostipes sp.]